MDVNNDEEEMDSFGLTPEQRREQFGIEVFKFNENTVWKIDWDKCTLTHEAYHCTTKLLTPEVYKELLETAGAQVEAIEQEKKDSKMAGLNLSLLKITAKSHAYDTSNDDCSTIASVEIFPHHKMLYVRVNWKPVKLTADALVEHQRKLLKKRAQHHEPLDTELEVRMSLQIAQTALANAMMRSDALEDGWKRVNKTSADRLKKIEKLEADKKKRENGNTPTMHSDNEPNSSEQPQPESQRRPAMGQMDIQPMLPQIPVSQRGLQAAIVPNGSRQTVQQPIAQELKLQQPIAQELKLQQPMLQELKVQVPNSQQPALQEPICQGSSRQQPVMQQLIRQEANLEQRRKRPIQPPTLIQHRPILHPQVHPLQLMQQMTPPVLNPFHQLMASWGQQGAGPVRQPLVSPHSSWLDIMSPGLPNLLQPAGQEATPPVLHQSQLPVQPAPKPKETVPAKKFKSIQLLLDED